MIESLLLGIAIEAARIAAFRMRSSSVCRANFLLFLVSFSSSFLIPSIEDLLIWPDKIIVRNPYEIPRTSFVPDFRTVVAAEKENVRNNDDNPRVVSLRQVRL